MSIARAPAKNPDNGTTCFSIDMQVLKDLKRHFLTMEIAGDRPPRYDKKRFLSQRGGNPLGCAGGIRGPPRYDKKNGS